jgi:hypothetical protein
MRKKALVRMLCPFKILVFYRKSAASSFHIYILYQHFPPFVKRKSELLEQGFVQYFECRTRLVV